MRVLKALIITLVFIGFTGCGGTDEGTDATSGTSGVDGSEAVEPTTVPLPFTCSTGGIVADGKNSGWMVQGQTREFQAQLPAVSAGTPVSVIFMWHGVGDTADNFRAALPLSPNSDPEFPYIAIYPQGLKLMPVSMNPALKAGMEWDIFAGSSGVDNLEAALFEEVLGCLGQQYTIDSSRIYVAGFSGGAIVTNMLHSRYPEYIGAIYAMSGAWFNDANQTGAVKTGPITVNFDWEALNSADEGAVILSHGGGNDWYGDASYAAFIPPDGKIIDFEVSAQHAIGFLRDNNRTVIDCPHEYGHQPHPQVYLNTVLEFFKAHRAGEKSSYSANGLPSSFPAACQLR